MCIRDRRQTFSPRQHGLCLFSVHTGGSHADLTGQYAAIPAEMKEVAACFDRQVLRQVPEDLFWARMGELRGRVCDRALLRAAHFFEEDRRTAAFEDALAQNDIPQILSLFAASGRSSQPVSYTHLDVYKRQILEPSTRFKMTSGFSWMR